MPWAYRTLDFIKDADRAFVWLVDFGFLRVDEDDKPNLYGNVVYANAELCVRATWEVRDSYVSVDFGPVIDGAVPRAWPDTDNGRRVRYPLWLLVWVTTGDEAFARSLGQEAGSRASIRQTLEQLARLLREHGRAIIAGDLSMLPLLDKADAQRIAANIDHNPWGHPPSRVAEGVRRWPLAGSELGAPSDPCPKVSDDSLARFTRHSDGPVEIQRVATFRPFSCRTQQRRCQGYVSHPTNP